MVGRPFKCLIEFEPPLAVITEYSIRSGCKLVTAEGKLFCVGGWNGSKILDTGEMYDPRSNRWTAMAPMNRARHGLELVSIGNQIYALGGWNGRKPLSSIERYHTRSDQWELLQPMSVGRWLMTAVALPLTAVVSATSSCQAASATLPVPAAGLK